MTDENPRYSGANEKKLKHLMFTGLPEDFARIKKFCEEEGLYMGRFMTKCALRHIEEVEHQRTQKFLRELNSDKA